VEAHTAAIVAVEVLVTAKLAAVASEDVDEVLAAVESEAEAAEGAAECRAKVRKGQQHHLRLLLLPRLAVSLRTTTLVDTTRGALGTEDLASWNIVIAGSTRRRPKRCLLMLASNISRLRERRKRRWWSRSTNAWRRM
jgi:hypothetical protein